MITVDISDLPAEVRRELAEGRYYRQVQDLETAEDRQRRIAREAGEHRSVDGLGRLRMAIDATAYHYWGQRLGYECWNDAQFLHEFERDNPHARVKCGGTKIMVGFRAADRQAS